MGEDGGSVRELGGESGRLVGEEEGARGVRYELGEKLKDG